ncbi:MAG: XylR family transcriptional regulator [Verrucomicrobiota bacterium]
MQRRRDVLLGLTDTHHGYLRAVLRYAKEHHWHLTADMIFTGKIPVGWRGDGIISFIGYRNDLADFILSSGLPAVEISFLRPDLPLPKVGGNNRQIGQLAAQHFLERRFRHFAWAPFMDNSANEERRHAFEETISTHGFSCHVLPPMDVVKNTSNHRDWAEYRKRLVKELKRLPKPLAIFCHSDYVAFDVVNACADIGLPVPEAVAVMGVDNDILFCESAAVPLSSVCHDIEGMAYRAAALLDRLMAGGKAPKKNLSLPPRGVVTRRSTDILAVENLEVSRALRFISDEFHNPLLSVSSVVNATKLSRRSIEMGFRTELNRSINDEILRVRLEQVRTRLSTTTLPVSEIAHATGFSSPNYLYRIFRETIGMTPKDYRQNAGR